MRDWEALVPVMVIVEPAGVVMTPKAVLVKAASRRNIRGLGPATLDPRASWY